MESYKPIASSLGSCSQNSIGNKVGNPPAALWTISPSAILPEGLRKYDVLRLVRRLRKPLGLTETDYEVLETLADPSRFEDWSDPLRQPMNYQMQCEMALRLGITARSFRRSEAHLEALGLIAKNVPINGYRSALRSYSMGQAAYGISLQPLIDHLEDLQQLDAKIERDREILGHLRLQVRVLRRKIGRLVDTMTDGDMTDPLYLAFLKERDTWPARPSRIEGTHNLSAHLEALKDYAAVLADNTGKCVNRRTDMSGAPDSNDRRHIQTIRTNTVRCNNTSSIRTDGKPSDSDQVTPPPNGSGESKEKEVYEKPRSSVNPALLEQLTPEVLMELISKDWAFYVESMKQPNQPLDWEDVEVAGLHMLRELGIAPSAYEEAWETMGPIDALLALIVIDRNRNHPARPIKSPGGALRAFARRHKSGNLNLQNSIFGLLQRDRIS